MTTVVIVVALGPIVIPMLIMLLGLVVAIVASAGSFIEDGSRYRYSDLKAELSRVPGVQLVGMHSTGGPSDPLGGSVIVDDRWQAFVEVPAGFNLNHNKSVAVRWGAKERTWTSNEAFTVLDLSRPNELDSVAGVPVRSVSDVVANLKTIVPWAERKRRVEPQTGRPRAVVIEVDAIRGRSTTDTPPRR